jgi:hypothetical protein
VIVLAVADARADRSARDLFPQNGAPSFDDLAGEDRGRDRQAERLRRVEIDDQLKSVRLLDRQIGRLGAFEDFVNVDHAPTQQIAKVRTIGYEPAGICELPEVRYRWQSPAKSCTRQE